VPATRSDTPPLSDHEPPRRQQPPAAPQTPRPQTESPTASRFIETHGDLYGDGSRYILFDIVKREIVFRSDDQSEVVAEANKRQPRPRLPAQSPRAPIDGNETTSGQLTLDIAHKGRAAMTTAWVPLKGHPNENSR